MNYPVTKNWDALIQWSLNHPDEDSHYIKTLRALMQGQKVGRLCRDQGKKPKLMISDMTWLQVGNMCKPFLILGTFTVAITDDCP
jgi:hypothetical protein